MFNRLTVKDVSVKDKNVLIRVDYNVPLENGKITSDLRVRASLPTINYLFENGAKKVILMSHLGRPEGVDPSLSLAPVADCLKKQTVMYSMLLRQDLNSICCLKISELYFQNAV